MIVLVDTCIAVDVLQKREPFYTQSKDIFIAVAENKITGCLTAKSITDIYYLLNRSLHDKGKVKNAVQMLFELFVVEDTLSNDCRFALESHIRDYEDAVMVQTAKRIHADYIITRNLKDYVYSDVPAVSPEQFIEILSGM